MRVISNEKYIARRATLGRYAGLAGLLVLLLALIFSCTVSVPLVVMQWALAVATVIGTLLSFFGGYYGDRFSGARAHHASVRKALKGLDDRYVLLQYTLPAPHVLLGPGGLTVFVIRANAGEITYADGKWHHRQRAKLLRRLAGQQGLGHPEADVQREVERLAHHLEERLPEVEVPVWGAVLFTHPEVELELEDPPVPALYVKQAKSWLRGSGERKILPSRVQRQLKEEIVGTSSGDGRD
jgi:hypothetical protein